MNRIYSFLTFFILTSQIALANEILSENIRKSPDFEFECLVHAALEGNMDCPTITKHKILRSVTDQELKDYLEKSTELTFRASSKEEIINLLKEFEININNSKISQNYVPYFLKYTQQSSDFQYLISYYQSSIYKNRKFALAYIFSHKLSIVYKYKINFAYK